MKAYGMRIRQRSHSVGLMVHGPDLFQSRGSRLLRNVPKCSSDLLTERRDGFRIEVGSRTSFHGQIGWLKQLVWSVDFT
jgi:hypothetical protein